MAQKFQWSGKRVTLEAVRTTARAIAERFGYNTARFSFTLHMAIICQFLGDDWFQRYAHLGGDESSPLIPRFDDQGHAAVYSMRILNLAEMLLNLQDVPGFEVCLSQLAGGQIESGLSELQLGMMLYQSHLEFAYVDPTKIPGKTYDMEVFFDGGHSSAAEIKCKEETTDLSPGTVKNSLGEARKQIPSGGDGIVFVKVPQAWAAERANELFLPQAIADTATAFVRSTSRVAAVVFYVFHLSRIDGGIKNAHAVREFMNPKKSPPWGATIFPFNKPPKWITMPGLIEKWSKDA